MRLRVVMTIIICSNIRSQGIDLLECCSSFILRNTQKIPICCVIQSFQDFLHQNSQVDLSSSSQNSSSFHCCFPYFWVYLLSSIANSQWSSW
ncbi:unnamed protein product [Moneuplotes crassus]|uniref:Uncharacterized protein n=1 Tax=Euplotes crassus TaxID=5936 RepID=A0AAD1XJ45_EUPCR|nr:unnamed protein product [Moneuplotes crassus]